MLIEMKSIRLSIVFIIRYLRAIFGFININELTLLAII
jgi:hypothetical protein